MQKNFLSINSKRFQVLYMLFSEFNYGETGTNHNTLHTIRERSSASMSLKSIRSSRANIYSTGSVATQCKTPSDLQKVSESQSKQYEFERWKNYENHV